MVVIIRRKPIDNSPVLVHHGVKGQKKGVRNGPPYPLNSKRTRKSASALSDYKLSKKEAAHVHHEVMTHATKEQRAADAFSKPIGPFTYYFENNHDGTFRIVGKRKTIDRMKEYWDD